MSALPPPKKDSHLLAKCHFGESPSSSNAPTTVPSLGPPPITTPPTPPNTELHLVPVAPVASPQVCPCFFGPRFRRQTFSTPMLPTFPKTNSSPSLLVTASIPNANPGLALKHYWSSPERCWSFCGKCGATIFYWSPDHLDVAVGILRAEEGSMARRWLDWEWGQCGFEEESIDREVCEAWKGSAEVVKKLGIES